MASDDSGVPTTFVSPLSEFVDVYCYMCSWNGRVRSNASDVGFQAVKTVIPLATHSGQRNVRNNAFPPQPFKSIPFYNGDLHIIKPSAVSATRRKSKTRASSSSAHSSNVPIIFAPYPFMQQPIRCELFTMSAEFKSRSASQKAKVNQLLKIVADGGDPRRVLSNQDLEASMDLLAYTAASFAALRANVEQYDAPSNAVQVSRDRRTINLTTPPSTSIFLLMSRNNASSPFVVGMSLHQSFPGLAIDNYNADDSVAWTEAKKRMPIWTVPLLVAIDRRLIRLDGMGASSYFGLNTIIANPSEYFAFPFVDAFEFPWTDFHWRQAVKLGEGQYGKVYRVQYIGTNNNVDHAKKLVNDYFTAKREAALPADAIHVAIALKVVNYIPTKSMTTFRYEFAFSILLHVVPPVIATHNGKQWRFDNSRLAPCYGFIVRQKRYGLVMKLFPYELGDKLRQIKSMSFALAFGTAVTGDIYQQQQGGAFTLRQLVQIVADVAHGLVFIHGNGYVHRDLKIANILLDSQMRAHVTDFGFVCPIGKYQTVSGSGMYLPEGVSIGEYTVQTPRFDIYALGITIREMFSNYLNLYWMVPKMKAIEAACLQQSVDAVWVYFATMDVLATLPAEASKPLY